MNLVIEKINSLPVPTWSWLGVNQAEINLELSDILPLAEAPAPPLPRNVVLCQRAQPEFSAVQTSAGKLAGEFVQQNRNAGAYLHVQPGPKKHAPIIYNYVLSSACPAVVDDNTIYAKAYSEITVVMAYSGADSSKTFHAGRTRIIAEIGAKVRLVQLQMLNEHSTHLNDVGVQLAENAHVEIVQIELGAQRALGGAFALLNGEKASFKANAIYFGNGARETDLNYVVKHLGKKTNSDMQFASALFDESKKIYRGTINFLRGSAHSVGAEKENTLLFSPKARSRSAPLILCGEENVEGQHAANIGKIDEAKLFYLNTRGLTSGQAKRMMVKAQFEPVLAFLPDESLRAKAEVFLEERMP